MSTGDESQPSRSSIRLLVISPDRTVPEIVTKTFSSREISTEIDTAVDGQEAEARLERSKYDAVLSAPSCEARWGLAAIERIRDVDSTIPTFLLTPDPTGGVLQQALEAGVTDCLPAEVDSQGPDLVADRILGRLEQVRTTKRAGELERVNRMVRKLNRVLVRAQEREVIDEQVCELISNEARYRLAWIGEVSDSSDEVTVRAVAGDGVDYVYNITISGDSGVHSEGPTGRAIRSGKVIVSQDLSHDQNFEPWREEALERGFHSSAAIPLVHEDVSYGVLNVYADRQSAFDPAEQELLAELGDTIAAAIHETQLREQAERFQRAVEQAADAIFITDIDGEIEYVNPAFEELTGYDFAEAVGRTPRILKSGVQNQAYYERMWEAIVAGDIWEERVVNAKRSGERYHAEQTIAPRRDRAGEIEGFVAIQRDVSERIDHERTLEQRGERLRILFENAPDGIIIHDVDGQILDVNERVQKNLGYPREELLSLAVDDIEVGLDPATLRDRWEAMEPGTVHRLKLEGRHRRLDGSTFPVEIWISRVSLTHTETDRFIAFIRDITDRKERERELRVTEQRLALAIETADAGVWEWHVQDDSVLWEDSMAALLDMDEAEFGDTYDDFLQLVHPDDLAGVIRTIDRSLEQQRGFTREFRMRRSSGTYIWIRSRAQLLTDDRDRPERMVGVGIDISERKDRTQQLQVMERVFRHNLRNDMTAIQGYAAELRDGTDDPIRAASVILEKSAGLMETVETEREIVEIISQRLEREALDVTALCERCAADARTDHPSARITVEAPEGVTALAISRFDRAIEELLDNAIIHHDRNDPEVSIIVEPHPDTIRILVRDDGPGIDESEVDILTRASEIKPLYHGSGLGLWLVNWIVRQSGGELSFNGRTPRGSEVAIVLERQSGDRDSA